MAELRHIAIYLPSLRGGGAERVMVALANGLAERGHRVDLVLVQVEGHYLREVADKVRVVGLNKKRVLASIVPLVGYLRRERPQAMLSAMHHVNLVAIVARALARAPTRLVVSERVSFAGLTGDWSSAVARLLMRRLYPRADRIVAVSRGLAQELITELGLDPEQIAAIPNPVDVGRIAALGQDRPEHPWLAPGSPPFFLAAGRLEPQKDYPTLLAAFKRVRARREVRLIILGEGSLRPQLERHVEESGLAESVMFAGFQPNPFAWMAAASVFVLSSRHEGFPNSLVQAMACGVPVVSTNCPTGPDEILEGGKWGRLVPVGDAEALAAAMDEALADGSPPDAQARLRHFAPDGVVGEYERVLT